MRVNSIILLLLFLLALALTADKKKDEYDIGSRFKISCNDEKIAIALKPRRVFSLSLVTVHIPQNVNIEISAKDKTCKMSKHQTICMYADSERELNITCTDDHEFVFEVVEPLRLTPGEKQKERYVEVSMSNITDSAILSVDITKALSFKIRELMHKKHPNFLPLFSYTSCVTNIALFEDHFKIAVQYVSQEPCVVGIRMDSQAKWRLQLTHNTLKADGVPTENYLSSGQTKLYELPQVEAGYNLFTLVESDEIEALVGMGLQLTFMSGRGEETTYNLTNFEKGVYPFRSTVHHPASASKLRIRSSIDSFFYLALERPGSIQLDEDQYLYTQLEKQLPFTLLVTYFLIQIEDFEDMAAHNASIKFILSDKKVNDHIKFKYAQCQDENCTKNGAEVQIEPEFQPKCKKLQATEGYCKLLVKVVNTNYLPKPASSESAANSSVETPGHSAPVNKTKQIVGILPYIPVTYEEIDLNKVHTGVLHGGEQAHFRIPKQKLAKIESEQIILDVKGAQAYVTYEPDCKRVYCCEFALHNTREQLPKFAMEDMLIILKGSGQAKYSLIIDTLDNNQFTLNDGYVLLTKMASDQQEKYFTFIIDDRSKDISINLNAPDGTIGLYANAKTNEFPTEAKRDYKSLDGQLLVKAEDIKGKKGNLLIMLKRIPVKHSTSNTTEQIGFTICVTKTGSQIQPITNVQYFDTLRPSQALTFVYDESNLGGSYSSATIKIDPLTAFDKSKPSGVSIVVGREKQQLLKIQDWNFAPIVVNSQAMKKVCKDVAKDLLCVLSIQIKSNRKSAIDISYLAWRNSKPIDLKNGEPLRVPTSGLGKQLHLFYKVSNITEPVNIYAYSNQVKIVVIAGAYKPEQQVELDSWPFPMPSQPSDPQKVKPDTEEQTIIQPKGAFTNHIYYDAKALEKMFGNATEKYILLTILQQYAEEDKKHGVQQEQKGFLHVAAATEGVKLRQEDKMEVTIEGDREFRLRYDVRQMVAEHDPSKNLIYFYNTQLSGSALIDYYFEADGIRVTDPIPFQRTFGSFNFDYVKSVISKYTSATINLIYHIKNSDQKTDGTFLLNLVTSGLQYHKLVMGIPTEFFISKNSSMVFEFIDNYHEDFKLKVFRKEGLPLYKVKSCSSQQSVEDCMLEVEKTRKVADPDSVLNEGRSHELLINHRSKEYCKDCWYYFAFFATTEDIFGAVTVMRDQTSTALVPGRAMTTQVEQQQTDVYMFTNTKNAVSSLIITPLKNSLKVWITEVDFNGKQIDGAETRKAIVEKDAVEIVLPALDKISWYGIHVQTREKEGSTYTLLLQHQDTVVNLEDGVSLNLIKKQGSVSTFEYAGKDEATLVVMSFGVLSVELSCPSQIKLNKTSMPGGTQTRVQSINPSQEETAAKSQSSSVAAEKLNSIDFSVVSRIRTFMLYPKKCPKYRVTIRNDVQTRFTVLVNAKDIVMIAPNVTLPGKLTKGHTQNYEMPITQSGKVRLVLRMCLNGEARIGLTQQRAYLDKGTFQNEFQTNGQQSHYVETFQVHPGMLYISVKSLIKPIDFTIEVETMGLNSLTPSIVAHLPKRAVKHKYIGEVGDEESQTLVGKAKEYLSTGPKHHEYELVFSGMSVEDENDVLYKVSYVVAQSQSAAVLKKFKDCRGALMVVTEDPKDHIVLTRANHTVVEHTMALTGGDGGEVMNSYVAKILYKTKHPNTFVTIVPVILPAIPGYATLETYKTVHLNRGASSIGLLQLVSSFIGMVHDGVQSTTNLSNGLFLNLLVLLTLVVLGMGGYLLSCCIWACCVYGWRMQRYQMIRTHQPSQHELRHNRHAQNNSLDMLESAPPRQQFSEDLPAVVEVLTNRFEEPTPAAPTNSTL